MDESLESLPEEELVRLSVAGDRDARELLVRRYERSAFRVAYHLLGSNDDARDAVQESFYRALKRLSSLRGRFGPWFFRILTNVCTDERRRRRRAAILPLTGTERAEPNPDFDLRSLVREALRLLPERYRTVIVLRDIEGFSSRETAEMLGINEGAARVLLLRARRRLADLIGQLEEGQQWKSATGTSTTRS